MKFDVGAGAAAYLGLEFWMIHLVLPLMAAILILTTLEYTGIDLWIADHWYALEGNRWALRDNWLTYEVIHHYGKEAMLVLGMILVIVLVTSYRRPALQHWRKPVGYLLTCMVVLPALIAYGKYYSEVPCPWDLVRYGGENFYHHSLSYDLSHSATGHCFPAGHAAGGFALLALYFAAYPFRRRPLHFLIPGLIVGFTFALGQQARGAHFLSHDLWTISFCWFGSLGLFVFFRPWAWPGTFLATTGKTWRKS